MLTWKGCRIGVAVGAGVGDATRCLGWTRAASPARAEAVPLHAVSNSPARTKQHSPRWDPIGPSFWFRTSLVVGSTPFRWRGPLDARYVQSHEQGINARSALHRICPIRAAEMDSAWRHQASNSRASPRLGRLRIIKRIRFKARIGDSGLLGPRAEHRLNCKLTWQATPRSPICRNRPASDGRTLAARPNRTGVRR